MATSLNLELQYITSEHRDKPKYIASVSVSIQDIIDTLNIVDTFPQLYDIDTAVGEQLDAVGEWVGKSRNIDVPLQVYFSLDVSGLGLDQGIWYHPFDPLTGLVSLPDDLYRVYLYATILQNKWDGTTQQAYDIWDLLIGSYGYTILIQDNPLYDQFFQLDNPTHGLDSGAILYDGQWHGTMSMSMALYSIGPVNAAVGSLFLNGFFDIKPVGVTMVDHILPSVPGTPFFGLDYDNQYISGLDIGTWGLYNSLA